MTNPLNESPYYCLVPDDGIACATHCTSLLECTACQCTVVPEVDKSKRSDILDVLILIFPIFVLILTVTVPRIQLPTTTSLPLSAALLFLIRLTYLDSDPLLTCSAVILGLIESLTPLSIMAGAIFLFETMQATGCLPFILQQIESLTGKQAVAELALIFSFAYLMEGASGFGTPAALCAPMLVRMGHETVPAIVTVLLFNTFATVWGAVGTPLWFGFQSVVQEEEELLQISSRAAISLAVSTFLLMFPILRLLLPWREIRANWVFTVLATASTVLPSTVIAFVNYEFPSLIGGMIGCVVTAFLIHFRVGMKRMPEEKETASAAMSVTKSAYVEGKKKDDDDDDDDDEYGDAAEQEEEVEEHYPDAPDPENPSSKQQQVEKQQPSQQLATTPQYLATLVSRSFPIWGIVVLLVLTRVEEVGLKKLLTKKHPYSELSLGSLGTFRLSYSMVFQVYNIMTYPNMNWKYELFYIPFLMPFLLVCAVTILLYRHEMTCSPLQIVKTVAQRLGQPAVALLGALVLVQLMIRAGTQSPAYILGTVLSDWLQEGFVVACPLLGALGSFFSGSTTVSNLTFGAIQSIAATNIGISQVTMLALQAVGGSAGNGICLNNIIAACAVVGLRDHGSEGAILLQTYKYVLASTTIATAVLLIFFFRF